MGCVPHGRLRPNKDEICGHIETKKDHATFPRVLRLPAYLLTAPQFQGLLYLTLDGTDHGSHEGRNSMIRR